MLFCLNDMHGRNKGFTITVFLVDRLASGLKYPSSVRLAALLLALVNYPDSQSYSDKYTYSREKKYI